MKIGSLIKRAAFYLLQKLIVFYSWLIFASCKIELNVTPKAQKFLLDCVNKPVFCCTWHGRVAVFPKLFNKLGLKFKAVVSKHKDGEIISKLFEHYGHGLIRGSSRKGAYSAMRELLAQLKKGGIIGVTPDGPKGPIYKLKGAIISVACKYNVPVVYINFSASRAFIVGSWDKLMLPLPFISKIYIEISEPIWLSKDVEDSIVKLENLMLDQMDRLNHKAGMR